MAGGGLPSAYSEGMSETICIGDLGDLPPGKGKVVEYSGRELTVFNVDGHIRATASHCGWTIGAEKSTSTCSQRGLVFDVFAEDSPADRLDGERCAVEVRGTAIWVRLH